MVAKKICTISNRSILIRVSEKGKKVILKAGIRKKNYIYIISPILEILRFKCLYLWKENPIALWTSINRVSKSKKTLLNLSITTAYI